MSILKAVVNAPTTIRHVAQLRNKLGRSVTNPWALAWRLLKSRQILCKAILSSGTPFYLRNTRSDIFVFEEVLLKRSYASLLEQIRFPIDTVVDIGANIGAFTVSLADKAQTVIAVEPDPSCAAVLQRNLNANGLSERGKVICAAAGSHRRRAEFITSTTMSVLNSLSGNSRAHECHDTSRMQVDVLPLADIFHLGNIERCNLLKLDCEGSEYEIISDANAEAISRVDAIVCEVHRRSEEDSGYSTIVAQLHDMGFDLVGSVAEDSVESIAKSVTVGHGIALILALRRA